jgi:hypothetical protein
MATSRPPFFFALFIIIFSNYDIRFGFDTYECDHTDPLDPEKSFQPAPMMAHVNFEVKCQIVAAKLSKEGNKSILKKL